MGNLFYDSRKYRTSHKVCPMIFHTTYSPVNLGPKWAEPTTNCNKIKLAPCCREFCEDFRKQKFTKINRVEHFQMAQFLCEPWGKILNKIGFGTFYQYGQIHLYFKSVWFVFVIKLLKTLYGRTNVCWTNYSLDYIPKIGRFYEKHPSFFLTATHSFSYNLAIIQQITFADGLNLPITPLHVIQHVGDIQDTSKWIHSDLYPLLLPLPPKLWNYAELPKSSYLLQNKLFVVNYSLFFRQKILLHVFWWGDIWLYLYEVMHR